MDNGYVVNSINGVRTPRHRYVMEQCLGRKLIKGEIVHHINRIKSDNRIENLQLTNTKEHRSLHKGEKYTTTLKLKKNRVIKMNRILLGLSHAQIAQQLEIAATAYERKENGRTAFTSDQYFKLSILFNTPIKELIIGGM